MAQPIPLTIAPRDPKRELLKKLEEAPAEHAAAILDSYELLQELHEHGVFSLIRGALGATDKLVEAATTGANTTESVRAMRNAIILAKMLGSIDPEILQGMASAVGGTLGSAKEVAAKPPGVLALLAEFAGAEQRRGLGLVSTFLKKLGAGLGRGSGTSSR